MTCRVSVPVLYGLNFLLFVVAVAMIAFPFMGWICKDYCNVQPKDLKSITFINVLVFFGAGLAVFSMFGCCLAHTAKKRFRVIYVFVLTAIVVALAAVSVYVYHSGFIIDRIQTFDPNAPANVQSAIDDLTSGTMKTFYEDFATLYEAGQCEHGPDKSDCPECHTLGSALQSCEKNWGPDPSPEAAKYLAQCSGAFDSTHTECDKDCTEQFCKCTGLLQETIKSGAKYVKIGVLGLTVVLFFTLIAACTVERTARQEEQQRRLLEEQQEQMLAAQGYQGNNGVQLARDSRGVAVQRGAPVYA